MKLRRSVPLLLGSLLIVSSLVWNRYFAHDATRSEVAAQINHRLTAELHEVEVEAQGILSKDSAIWQNLAHSFFIMDSTQVLKWNNNAFLPDIRTVLGDFSLKLLQWPRGVFLLKKWQLANNTFLLAVIPLQNRYKINNRYLISGWNKKIFPIDGIRLDDPGASDGYSFIWDGQPVFKLYIDEASLSGVDRVPSTLLISILIGCVLFFIGLSGQLWQLHRDHKYEEVFLILSLVFVGGRVLMLFFVPSIHLALFDPSFFASSSYNRSIGDLFLNILALLVPVLYLFFNYPKFTLLKSILGAVGVRRSMWLTLMLLLCYFVFLFPFLFFETIFHNSSISLDITQSLQWNSVRLFSFLSVILGYLFSYLIGHVFFRIAISLSHRKSTKFYLFTIIAGLLFLGYSVMVQRDYYISLSIAVTYFLLLWWLSLPRSLKRTSFVTFLYFFLAICAFALQGAFAVRRFTVEERLDSQFRFANTFLIDRDYLGEYLLDESASRIASDPFIQTRMGSPFLSKSVVRQKVKQVYLNSYFDRYDVQIHLFNSVGNSYDNSTTLRFSELIKNFQSEANKTNYEGVFFVKNTSAESTKQYLVVIPINRFNVVTGYIVLDLSLKRIIPRNVFPELLLDNRFIQYFKNRNFSYAFYSDGAVVNSFGDYNFEKNFAPSLLHDPDLYREGVTRDGYLHVGIEDESGKIVIVSAPSYLNFNVVTNFSFFFTIGLNLILISLLVYGGVTLYLGRELNYSARIQLYVVMAFILPLFLVSATTLGLINKSAETQLNAEYIEKSRVLSERIAPMIDEYLEHPTDAQNELDNKIIELTKLANLDASVFTPQGKLLTTSQPLIYEDRILSPLINRQAWEAISREKELSFINNEKIGTLSFNSSYYALKSPDSGELIGILSLPFFESAYSLEKTQINVLANILTIFCIAFILFSIVSFFAVRWLTFPLQFITKTLRKTTLTGSNEPLKWHSNDEIGLMVSEYNRMLENLEQSKVELSRVQKETAWREIAKQVAHEIKNPLTPMKLTLQQMEHALLAGQLTNDKASKSVQTLLNQVEILNEIAASFSAFARMPAPILQKIEVTSLLRRVVHLHADYKEGEVILSIENQPQYIMGDEQLLSRIFSNIILNGLQSGEEGQPVTVRVIAKTVEGKSLLSFSDNGKGIDPELGEKIFLPHFSTKKSGSGLGLAIAKQGVEQNGGIIHFETTPAKGSTFYVEIPLVIDLK